LGDAVTFRPVYVPHVEVATYFAAADVAVFNYRDVTDSGTLRVAASLGTPIVATSVGAFREFLADGATGRLVPPGDARALAATLGDVLADVAGAAGWPTPRARSAHRRVVDRQRPRHAESLRCARPVVVTAPGRHPPGHACLSGPRCR
jgi:glycosyltransferase involved in cell wall biosynthesis